MRAVLDKIKTVYKANPKIQMGLLFVGIFGIMYLIYSWSVGTPKKNYSNLNKAAKTMQAQNKAKAKEKPKPKKKTEFKQTISAQAKQAAQKKRQEAQEKENAQNINTIRKNRFDSDINKKFDFDNQF